MQSPTQTNTPERKLIEVGSGFMTADPPKGMGIRFYAEAEGVVAFITLDDRHEGPPGYVHGGFSAALLDEAMGTAVWRAGHPVVAANIQFDLRAPVPLGQEISVQGWVDRKDGKKVFAKGKIVLADGTVAVEGRGLFIEAPQFFQDWDGGRATRAFKTADED
jgi:acyl-coenzyme A thioesterase PaaI-like protein